MQPKSLYTGYWTTGFLDVFSFVFKLSVSQLSTYISTVADVFLLSVLFVLFCICVCISVSYKMKRPCFCSSKDYYQFLQACSALKW